MSKQTRSLSSPAAKLVYALRHSLQARILLVAVSGAVLGIALTTAISFVGIDRLAGDASRQIEAGLGATTREDLGNQIETTAALVNARIDHAQADLRILADITQKLIDHREEFHPLTEAVTEIPFFEDKMVYHPEGRYSQNAPDEPTVVTVQGILHDESFRLKPYPQQILDETALLDLIMPSIHTQGAKKTWTYFVGGEGASFLRLTPWTDFGRDSLEIYPEQMDVSYWSFFPGLVEAWETWLRDPDSARHRPSDVTSTQPIIDGATGTTIQIFGHPLWNRERTGFAGAVWYDVQLDELTGLIEEIELAETGFAFLALADGNVIAIPERGLGVTGLAGTEYVDEELHLHRHLANSREPAIAALTLPQDDGVHTLDARLSGRDYILMMRRLAPTTGFRNGSDHTWVEHWTLGFVVARDEIYAPLARVQQGIEQSSRVIFAGQGIVLVTTILALMILVYLIAQRMTQGLTSLAASTRQIREGNYDVRVTVRSQDELGELGAAFNEMAGQLRNSFERVAQQNLELRAEITERERMEEALRESEANLRRAQEIAHLGSWSLDLRANRFTASDEMLRIFRHTGDQIDFDEWTEFVHPDDRERVARAIEDTIAGKRPHDIEFRILRSDGESRALHLQWEIIYDESGEPVRMIGTGLDITERVRAEEERTRLMAQLREQAQRVQQIVDTVPEGVLLLEAGERVVQANPLGEKELVPLAGVGVGDVLTHLGDRPLAELLTSPPRGLWHEVAADGRSFQVIARPFETGATPGGWVLVIRDVTQQREIQRRIQQQERLAAVGQLAAGIAHDFNNIMATVVLYAQLTARDTSLPAHVRERMKTIDGQAAHATRLIQQILDFGRRAMLERRQLDLAPLLEEHVILLERTLPESIEIALTCEPEAYLVRADPTRLQQMVTNLALNARDAMPQGGELRIDLARITVDEEARITLNLPPEIEAGEWIRITVSDTGVGIPPDVLGRIFEPFFTTKAPLGSGLGLSQVHGIVAQHEGTIDVESQVGQGTAFIIYLPALRREGAGPSTPPPPRGLPPLPQGQGETILVVEDDPVVRRSLVESLEMLNYRTLEASNGSQALAILQPAPSSGESPAGESPDVALILSDVVMPSMGGIALLHALREQGSPVKVVMLTGHHLQQELEELHAQGMIDWLPKPPRLEELAEMIARVLGTGRALDA